MSGDVSAALEIPDHEQTLVEDVGNNDAQKKSNVKFSVVDGNLDDETHDAAVKHYEVPFHTHKEEVAKGEPLVFE